PETPSTDKPADAQPAGKGTREETPNVDAPAVQVSDSPLVSERPPPSGDESPVYERWWFWTAVGGAVLALAGGTALALSSGGHTKTELPHGSAGTIDWR